MGTSLVFIPIFLSVCYLGGMARRHLAFLVICLALTIVFLFYIDSLLLKVNSPLSRCSLAELSCPILWLASRSRDRLSFGASVLQHQGFSIGSCSHLLAFAYRSELDSLGGRFLQDYQVKRLIVFLAPDRFPNAEAWNILQSLNAIGSGGVAGQGYLQGPQIHSGFVPEKSTDFIFSVVAEEWGFLGGSLVFFLFAVVLIRGYLIMRKSRDPFAVMVAGGILGMIFYHFAINIGMISDHASS